MNAYGMPYEPTWVDPAFGELTPCGEIAVVYDTREGFQPAYAVVFADTVDEAAVGAEEMSAGRLAEDSETLVVNLMKIAPPEGWS